MFESRTSSHRRRRIYHDTRPVTVEEGRILAILVNGHEGTPDKYDVVFGDGRSEIPYGLDRFNRCLSKPGVLETSREGKEETETKHGWAQGATQAARGDTADAVVREKGGCPGPA